MAKTNPVFEIYAGDSVPITIPVTNADGSAMDLTGATIKWALKAFVGSKTNLVYKDTDSGVTITNPAGGIFTVTLIPTDTADMHGTYSQGAEVIDQLGFVTTIEVGPMTINPAVV